MWVLSNFLAFQDEVELMTAVRDWSRVCTAFEVLGVDQKEEEVFWLVLAAITNLGVLTTKIGKYFNSLLYLILIKLTVLNEISFYRRRLWVFF